MRERPEVRRHPWRDLDVLLSAGHVGESNPKLGDAIRRLSDSIDLPFGTRRGGLDSG